MRFADNNCYLCGFEFGDEVPEEVTKVDKLYVTLDGRGVDFVAPCPSCGKAVPLWDPGEPDAEPEVELDPEPEVEPDPEPEVEPDPEPHPDLEE